MAVTAAGVVSNLRTDTSDPWTWSHDQGTTSPQGVVVMIMHGTSTTDHVVSVDYGGVSLTRIQRNIDDTTEPGASEIWFRGNSIPTGTQTVTADLASGTTDDLHGVSVTLDGDDNLEVVDFDGISLGTTQANPSVTLSYAGRTCMAFACLYSGVTAETSIAAGTDCTKIGAQELTGNFSSAAERQTTAGSSDFTIGFTVSADDVAFSAIAVSEVLPVIEGDFNQSLAALTLVSTAEAVVIGIPYVVMAPYRPS